LRQPRSTPRTCGRAASSAPSIVSPSSNATAFAAVFAVLPRILQRASPRSPQKSRGCGERRAEITAGCLAVFRCFPLFFADFRYSSRCPIFYRLSQDHRTWGRAGPPVFAENLQALTIPFRSPSAALNIVISVSVIPRNTANHVVPCQCKLLQKYVIVNKIMPLNKDASSAGFSRERNHWDVCAAVVRDHVAVSASC
jgi:hypothetical protein